MRMTPEELAHEIGKGLLSFPVTPFNQDGSYARAKFLDHLDFLASYKPAAFFTACGTGEFFSITQGENDQITRDAVAHLGGKLPVLAGAGYGTAIAVEMAQSAEAAGADGILLLPPYLLTPDAAGLADHISAVCSATKLGVTIYNRDNAILDENHLERLAEKHANLVGFKDGHGDVELMVRVQNRLSGRLTFIGGLPTAETFALPYLDMGVNTYSSAIFNFLPEFATTFHAAVLRRDHAAIHQMLRDFVLPYIAIRSRKRGYAVSIVKAGLRAIGRDCGPVRSPLTDLTALETAELAALIAKITPVPAQPKVEALA